MRTRRFSQGQDAPSGVFGMISKALITAGVCLAAGAASTQSIPYPDTFTQNAATYSFTATATGQVDACFAAQTSAY